VFGDWDNPYLTMDPGYEAEILRAFAKLVENGAVYQSKKPVQWSYGAHTALAEAEVEYQDKESPAMFVKFALTEGAAEKLPGLGRLGRDLDDHAVDAAGEPRAGSPSAVEILGGRV
jgi:isoleucyl-tRNA synthetase